MPNNTSEHQRIGYDFLDIIPSTPNFRSELINATLEKISRPLKRRTLKKIAPKSKNPTPNS